jgi:hypothetical protein
VRRVRWLVAPRFDDQDVLWIGTTFTSLVASMAGLG